jgi:hypothetical protein
VKPASHTQDTPLELTTQCPLIKQSADVLHIGVWQPGPEKPSAQLHVPSLHAQSGQPSPAAGSPLQSWAVAQGFLQLALHLA